MNHSLSLTYYAHINHDHDGYTVQFRDFDNIFSEGDTLEEALNNAQDALDGVLAEMAKADYDVKLPSQAKPGEHAITVSADIAAPVLLHILRKKRLKTLTQVAKIMQVPYQQYQRLERNCNMTLKSLKKAVSALGGRVEIKLHW